jgi:hypothetical protein
MGRAYIHRKGVSGYFYPGSRGEKFEEKMAEEA